MNNITKNQNDNSQSVVKLLDKDFIGAMKDVYNKIINFDDKKKALELSDDIKKTVDFNRVEFKKRPEIYNLYKRIYIRLRFIALPYLKTEEIVELLRKYFTMQFKLPDYNFIENLKLILISISVIEERDNFKNNLKKALLENQERITSGGSIKKVSSWLKDYNVKLGIGNINSLKRAEYLTNLKKDKTLSDEDRRRLKILFEVYEFLKTTSKIIAGMEEEYPVMVNGKLYIFRQGFLDPVQEKNVSSVLSETTYDKNISNPQLEELQNMLNKYPEGSLERKAVEEELGKLEGRSEKSEESKRWEVGS